MATYATNGKKEWPEFHMPIVYRHELFLAESHPNQCQLFFLEDDELMLKDREHSYHYPAPLMLLIKSDNKLEEIQSKSLKCHNFIFTPDALNANIYQVTPWVIDSPFFFLNPFHELPEKAYSCRSVPIESSLKLNTLCEKMEPLPEPTDNPRILALLKPLLFFGNIDFDRTDILYFKRTSRAAHSRYRYKNRRYSYVSSYTL
jgi:hypothetical protein